MPLATDIATDIGTNTSIYRTISQWSDSVELLHNIFREIITDINIEGYGEMNRFTVRDLADRWKGKRWK